jgi:hypothetical protein
MAGTAWSKFFWSDWQGDPALRLCSLAAQGLWMRMLCVAASHDPIGYVAVAGRGLEIPDLARLTGEDESEVQLLLGELERNGVFSRDRHRRIYNRRMVRDAKRAAVARENGKKGGNPSLGNSGTNSGRDKGEVKGDVKPHKPEARSHMPERAAALPESPRAELDRIEAALRCAARLENSPAPGLLDLSPILGLMDAGYHLEQDILPTIRAKKPNGKMPATWAYFVPAIHEARGRRKAAAAVPRASPRDERKPALLPGETEEQRLRRMWKTWCDSGTGGWPMSWGPTPDCAGCQIPKHLIAKWTAERQAA